MTLPIPTNGWGQLWLFVGNVIVLLLYGGAFYAAVKTDNDQIGKWTIGVLLMGSLFFGGYQQGLQSAILSACTAGR